MEEIMHFGYKDYELCLFYDGNTSLFAKRQNSKIDYNISNEEKNVIKFIYKMVMPSKMLRVRNDIHYANKTYKHFVDKKHSLHLFYEWKNNELFIPEEEVRKRFNYLYNNQELICYEINKDNSQREAFFKRIVKIGKKALVVFVATSAILGFDYLNHNKLIVIEDETPIIYESDIPTFTSNGYEYKIIDTTEKTKLEKEEKVNKADATLENNSSLDQINSENDGYENDLINNDNLVSNNIDSSYTLNNDVDTSLIKEESGTLIENKTSEKDNIDSSYTLNNDVDSSIIKQDSNTLPENSTSEIANSIREEFKEGHLPYIDLNLYKKYPDLQDKRILVKYNGTERLINYDKTDNYVYITTPYNYQYEFLDYEIPQEFQDCFEGLTLQAVEVISVKNHITYDTLANILNLDPNLTETEKSEALANLQLTYDDVKSLINYNQNLSEEEKNYILSNPKYIMDNLKYMDNYYIANMLCNLKVEYHEEEKLGVGGEYDLTNYKINLYKTHNFEECDKSTFTHELCHAFSSTFEHGSGACFEIFNSIINNEYWGNGNSRYDTGYGSLLTKGYGYLPSKGYALIEILGPETIKEAYFKADTTIIKNELMKIINDEDLADETIELLNFSVNKWQELRKISIFASYDLTEEDYRYNDIIKSFYEAKYKTNIEDNLEMLYYMDEDNTFEKIAQAVIQNDTELKFNLNPYIRTGLLHQMKTYFNDELNRENNSIQLVFYKDIIGPDGKPITEEDINKIGKEMFSFSYNDAIYYSLNQGILDKGLER